MGETSQNLAAPLAARDRADMGLRKKILRVATAFGAMGLVGAALPSVAAATTTPSVECSVVVENGTPSVRYVSNATEGRLIIERQAFNRYWWRGRIDLPSSSSAVFSDRPLPKTAAQVKYRVRLRATNGKIVTSADCSVVPSGNVFPGACVIERTDGAYQLSFGAVGYDDVVFRRTVSEGGSSHWRGVSRQQPHQLTDSSRELSFVQYQALGRDNGVIQEVFDCHAGGELACDAIDVDGLVDPIWGRQDGQDVEFNGVRARVLSSADNVDGFNRLVVQQPSLGASVCDDNVRRLAVAGGKLYYFTTDDPLRLSILTTYGSPTIEPVANVSNWPAFTDDGIYYLTDDGSLHRIDSASGATTRTDNVQLRPYLTGNMAAAPNGNVYYVLTDQRDDSRYLMEWDAATATNSVFTELPNNFDGPEYIAVNRDGSQLELQDESGFPYGYIDL